MAPGLKLKVRLALLSIWETVVIQKEQPTPSALTHRAEYLRDRPLGFFFFKGGNISTSVYLVNCLKEASFYLLLSYTLSAISHILSQALGLI